MRVLVLLVIYPNLGKYLKKCIDSIDKQTYQNFDLLCLDDGYPGKTPDFLGGENVTYRSVSKQLTPSKIRETGIRYANEHNYDFLILADADDFFSENRFELMVQELSDYTFLFNDLIPVNEQGITIEGTNYEDFIPKETIHLRDILSRNLFGLTHTAINLNKVKSISIPSDIIATDWWIFSNLLLEGANCKFIPSAKSYYRQREDNTVGMRSHFNEELLYRGIRTKKKHYDYLLERDKIMERDLKKRVSNKLESIRKLESKIENPDFRKKYIEVINQNQDEIYEGWWSQILPLRIWKKYRNSN